jgi:poly-gamma-glutamate synthesis protein (capsule biosynthesis protein)
VLVARSFVVAAALAATPSPAGPAGEGVDAPPPVPRVVSMAFAGDALWHSPLWQQAASYYADAHPGASGFDFTPMLAPLAPVVGAVDLAVCHLETPIAPDGEAYSTFPLYGVPAEVVTSIAAAGFDRCSTASNHTVDRGIAGIDRTVNVLEAAGLGQSGMARNPAEIEPHLFEVDGVRISHLSYTFGYNGLALPPGDEWRSALIDPQRIIDDARMARVFGAEIVIVSMHWGVEGRAAPTPFQIDVANRITASGDIDLVVGHHAHVLQPIEQVNGTWVLFGMGNMISNLPTSPRWPAATQDGAIALVDIAVAADGAVTVSPPVIHPTWVDRDHGWTVYLVKPTLSDTTLDPWLRNRLEASLTRTASVLAGFLAP